MDDTLHDYSFAKAAVEMALFDIVGKALGIPIYVLLGGKVRDKTTLSYSIANQDIQKDLDEIKWLLDQGIFVFKIKTGVLPSNRKSSVSKPSAGFFQYMRTCGSISTRASSANWQSRHAAPSKRSSRRSWSSR